MLKKINVFFCIIFLILFAEHSPLGNRKNNHPLYISVAEFVHNNQDKLARISCKAFTNDFELALQNKFRIKETKANSVERKQLSYALENYIKTNLVYKINNRLIGLKLVDYKIENEAVWCNFQMQITGLIHKVEVTDTIFFELFTNQIQIINVTIDGNRKTNTITSPAVKVSFDF